MSKKNTKHNRPLNTPAPPPPVQSLPQVEATLPGLPVIPSGRFHALLALVLLLLAALLYGRTVGYDYTLDDQIVYSKNRFVEQGFAGIKDILNKETFSGYFKDQQNLLSGARYRPLSLVTFAIEKGLWGGGPAGAHTINWLLYALSSFFVFLLARTMLRQFVRPDLLPWLAGLAALIFLLHPLHVEVVANIKGRDEILCLLFALMGGWAFFKWYDGKHMAWFILGSVAIFLSLLAKESSIILSAALPVALYVCRPGLKSGRLGAVFIALLVASGLYLLMRYNAVGFFLTSGKGSEDRILMNNPYLNMYPSDKWATISFVTLLYAKLLVFPTPLTHDYYPWHVPAQSWSSPGAILGLVMVIGLLAYTVFALIKKRFPAAPLVWILLSTLLISNLFINVGTTMNERFMYFASFGFVVLLVYLISLLLNGKYKWLAYLLAAYFILFGAARSFTRIPDWKDNLTLNESGVKVSPNSARANLFMGVTYFQQAQKEKDNTKKRALLNRADSLFNRASEIVPDYSYANSMLTGSAAELYLMDGNIQKLFASFKKAMLIEPDLAYPRQFLQYLNRNGKGPEVSIFLADIMNSLQQENKAAKARDIYNFARTMFPENYRVDTVRSNPMQ